jgi:clan AA aspartic protease (TIGR02281 family)
MTKENDPRGNEGPRISADDRLLKVSSTSRSPLRLVGGVLVIATIGIAVAFFVLNGDQKGLTNDRQHVAALHRGAANAVRTLNKEPCHRIATIQLLRAYKKAQMTRAIVNEISKFEQTCAPLPEAQYDLIQALLVLSEFKTALPVADVFVAKNLAAPDAWAVRAEVKEHLGDLAGASHDLQQALALFPNPSKVVASSWYRLTDVLNRQGRFCEAVVPLQTFVSYNPTKRRTQQISTLLRDLKRKGNCIQTGKVRKVTFRYPPGASALEVEAKINGISGHFIIDTGASNVSVIHEFAKRARLTTKQSRLLRVNTANGPVQVMMSIADTITLSGLTARKVPVNIHLKSKHGFGGNIDGLLGLSFISNFDFNLRDGVLVLTTP